MCNTLHLQKAPALMPGCIQVSLLPFLLWDVTVLLRRVLSGTDMSAILHISEAQTLMPGYCPVSLLPFLLYDVTVLSRMVLSKPDSSSCCCCFTSL